MNESILLYSCFMLFGTFISAISQVLLKKAAMRSYASKIQEYLTPPVIIAYVLFFAATLMTIIAYQVVPLSFGPVLEATSYLYVTAFGALFFGEKLTKKKLAALVLIIGGIVLYSFSV